MENVPGVLQEDFPKSSYQKVHAKESWPHDVDIQVTPRQATFRVLIEHPVFQLHRRQDFPNRRSSVAVIHENCTIVADWCF
jgi:hypothetical protein